MSENFKIYTLDILSILLPGAMFVAILSHFPALVALFNQFFPENNSWIGDVVYVALAYVSGHFIFFLGSFLDRIIFDTVKRLIWKDQELLNLVVAYKRKKTGINDVKILNAFKWACARLLAEKPDMYSVVERYVAESKFFRSLIIVLAIGLVAFISDTRLVVIFSLLGVLSIVRYLTQRQKSIETAYQFIIAASDQVFEIRPPTAPYASKEIRWFFRPGNRTIEQWFGNLGKEISKTTPRTDFYLPIPDKDDISVKLREGNIEVKQRSVGVVQHKLTSNAHGYLEDWIKWSFDTEDQDSLVHSIIDDKKYDWIEVQKERIGVKVTVGVDGSIQIKDIKEMVPFGCQIEYTRLEVMGQEWFTFGLEWFGKQHFELPSGITSELLKNETMTLLDSKNYNKFLNSLRQSMAKEPAILGD
jgi:hypothetical protein